MNVMVKKLGINKENKNIPVAQNQTCYELLKQVYGDEYNRYLLVKINNTLKELSYNALSNNDEIEFLDIKNADGMRIYIRTLSFIFIKACRELFENTKSLDNNLLNTDACYNLPQNQSVVSIEHSLNKGLFAEIKIDRKLTEEDITNIKIKMQEIIDKNIPINKQMLSVDEAKKIFLKQCMPDKISLLSNWDAETIRVYELDGYYDMFYGYVAPNTNVIYKFDLKLFESGVILRYPSKENVNEFPEYAECIKLAKIFKEAEDWGDIMEVAHVGALNEHILKNKIHGLILVNEALHEKKIAYIADEISANKDVRIVLIAGPSSSGKTTFAGRLSIQLRVNGKKTYAISLDDYFVDREKTPRDENGNYDFDTIDALDIELFNDHLLSLMNGHEVQIPTFEFKTGKRIYDKKPVKLSKDHIIVVEGIHGLNDKLTSHIYSKNKFKIYISALTQLNIDNHNMISTSDTRLIRRIVRDNQFRGHNAQSTISMWANVRKGEEKYIFPFQENADAMFNSSLTYELGVLKKYVVPLIEEIKEDSEFYPERQRLLKFLSFFRSIENENMIPNTSILKEFIGGGIL
jgi:uridine kinase